MDVLGIKPIMTAWHHPQRETLCVIFSVGDNFAQMSSGGNTRRHITPATSAKMDRNMTAPRRKTSAQPDE